MKAFRGSFTSALKRKFSNVAAPKHAINGKELGKAVKIGQAREGMTIATIEDGSPVARLAFVYNAGPRFESYDNQGVTHYMRALCSQSSNKVTSFGLTRTIEQLGGNFTCTTNREQVIYSVEIPRNYVDVALECLDHVANSPAFKPWEVEEIKSQLSLQREVFEQTPEARVVEMLHKAAYRDGLGNSLYISRDRIGSIDPEKLHAFHERHYMGRNAAIVGLGVDHEFLLQKTRELNFARGEAPELKKQHYYGGELREDVKGDLVFVSCAVNGFGMDTENLLVLSLLQHIIGVGPNIKYSSNQVSKLSKAVSPVASGPYAVSCFNCNYSNSGLFGINLVSGATDSGKILKSVFQVINQTAKGKFSSRDLETAKNNMKASLLLYAENSKSRLEWLGIEALLTKQYLMPRQVCAAIDMIGEQAVAEMANKVLNGKPSMAALGNLSHTPYMNELFHL